LYGASSAMGSHSVTLPPDTGERRPVLDWHTPDWKTEYYWWLVIYWDGLPVRRHAVTHSSSNRPWRRPRPTRYRWAKHHSWAKENKSEIQQIFIFSFWQSVYNVALKMQWRTFLSDNTCKFLFYRVDRKSKLQYSTRNFINVLADFQNSFTVTISRKFAIKW